MAQHIKDQMKKNSAAWHGADANERKRLEAENQKLGAQIGGNYNASAGTWSDQSGAALYDPQRGNNDKVVQLNPPVSDSGYNNNFNQQPDSGGYLDSVNRALGNEGRNDFGGDIMASGKTLGHYGYDRYYDEQIKSTTATRDSYLDDDWRGLVPQYNMAIENWQNTKAQHDQFKDWDTGVLRGYIQNKTDWEKATDPAEKARLAAINKQIRDVYGLEEDTYGAGGFGQLNADMTYGDFIQYGLNKEENYQDIPAIGSSNDNYDPKFEMARQMARSDSLLGYEPLGQWVGDSADAARQANRDQSYNMLGDIRDGIPLQNTMGNQNKGDVSDKRFEDGAYDGNVNPSSPPQDQINHINSPNYMTESIKLMDELLNSINKGSGPVNVTNTIILDQKNPAAGQVYETNQGRFMRKGGEIKQITDANWENFLTQQYGF